MFSTFQQSHSARQVAARLRKAFKKQHARSNGTNVMKFTKDKKGKVFVGLSGGVDSSVAVALLKKRGFDVTGVFIKVWEPDIAHRGVHSSATGIQCTWRDDRRDAMRVAAHLDIPFITMDLGKEYKKEIVDYMVSEYSAGRTPNPDVMCNKYIKFGAFFKHAMEAGADFVATGHYARLMQDGVERKLLMGVDGNKDQSYFLWTLTQKQLRKTLFPIGEYEKSEVRKMAKSFGLPTAEKKDSQGLCFVGKLDMKEFLKEFISEKRGDVLSKENDVIGWHDGVYFYTLGQRHGFTVTKKGTDDTPYYVVGKNVDANTITVSHKETSESTGVKTEIFLKNTNWISSKFPISNKEYTARVRYRQALQYCKLSIDSDRVKIVFKDPQIANPGQSAVIYDKQVCLGGGIIV